MKGHAGIEGNEMADLMANRGATLPVEEERDWEMLAKIVDDEIREELKRRQVPVVNRGTSSLDAEVCLLPSYATIVYSLDTAGTSRAR